ncbi:MAG: hypothetical protein L3J70_06000 [Gammaproteobacteria bacterium]|nr:hypothetical protein [Gammaproteobacteria bacterium]
MTYMIDARLEQGAPSITLIDAVTGKERLHWRGDNSPQKHDWQSLFKRLMLLSCADRINLVQRSKSPSFGEECLVCTTCIEPHVLNSWQCSFSTPCRQIPRP